MGEASVRYLYGAPSYWHGCWTRRLSHDFRKPWSQSTRSRSRFLGVYQGWPSLCYKVRRPTLFRLIFRFAHSLASAKTINTLSSCRILSPPGGSLSSSIVTTLRLRASSQRRNPARKCGECNSILRVRAVRSTLSRYDLLKFCVRLCSSRS